MTKTIGMLLFPDAEELDFVGPFEVLGAYSAYVEKEWQVITVAATQEPVRCAKGLVVVPDHTFGDCPPLDVLLIPGGIGTQTAREDSQVLSFVRRQAAGCQWVTSVCTGSFVLASAGLLEGRRAATYWAARNALREEGIDVVEERWVHDGNVITAGGVSAGIDMALYLVGQLSGPEVARKVQQYIEYYPEPPYAEEPVASGREATT